MSQTVVSLINLNSLQTETVPPTLTSEYTATPSASPASPSDLTSASDAFTEAIETQRLTPGAEYSYVLQGVWVEDSWAYAEVTRISASSEASNQNQLAILLAHRNADGSWSARLPEDGLLYNEWLDEIPDTFLDNLLKDMNRWTPPAPLEAAAIVSGHYLPWPSPYGARVTQNYNTHLPVGGVGQIDFVPDVNDVLATKGGTIVYINDTHPDWLHWSGSSPCSYNGNTIPCSWYAYYNNVVVIRHSASEYTIYLHLKQGSIPSTIKNLCPNFQNGQQCAVAVQRGQKIGEMGTTGY